MITNFVAKIPMTAGHFHVMRRLLHFGVKSVGASVFLMQNVSTIFSSFRDADNKFFFGSQSYFSHNLSWVHY